MLTMSTTALRRIFGNGLVQSIIHFDSKPDAGVEPHHLLELQRSLRGDGALQEMISLMSLGERPHRRANPACEIPWAARRSSMIQPGGTA